MYKDMTTNNNSKCRVSSHLLSATSNNYKL